MAPRHLDRLSAIDASFLHQEGAVSHMHIGALVRAAGPAPAYDDFLDSIRARLHYVPRYRQRLVYPPAGTGRPLWADDADFNLEYHVRHTALPTPGSDEQLKNLAARVFSQQLDRSKPLWELWLVEGLADGGFALLSKSHHAMIDGIAGVDLGTVLFDLGPEGRPPEEGLEPWMPDPAPSPLDLLTAGITGMTKATLGVAAKALGSLSRPERALEDAKVKVEGIGEIVWAAANPAPASPLNVEIGPHRRFTGVACDLPDFKAVKNAFGGTVNDVVLAVVAGALRSWLQSRGPRINFSTRLFNLLVTNVPGPQFPLYIQGRKMSSVFPIAFLPSNHALAIAIMSYDGHMNFGLLGDYDAMYDLDDFGHAIESALADLVSLAAATV